MSIGKALQAIMESSGTNPNELSNKTGVPKGTIYSIVKRDNTKIDIDILFKLCKGLGITTDDLLNYKSERLIITEHETKLVKSYRLHPELQPAIDKMLDITEGKKVTVVSAARSPTSQGAEQLELTEEQLEKLKNAPDKSHLY